MSVSPSASVAVTTAPTLPAVETAASPTVSVKLRDAVPGANTGALLVTVVPAAVPLTAKIMRLALPPHTDWLKSAFHLAMPMLHPVAAPVSAVDLSAVLTRKPWPLAAALLLTTSQ